MTSHPMRAAWSRARLYRLPPPALLALLYVTFILVGTALLRTPWAMVEDLGWGGAFFTATSAVTVTGLVLADTGAAFTPFGQGVIAVLIQIGGLGLMVFAVLLLTALGIPIGMPQRIILREDLGQTSLSNLAQLARLVLKVALLCEAVGVAALMLVFVPEFGWAGGAWQAVFHTVSAFNNAGFALFPDSLSRWAGNPMVNLVVPALFIIGGLGFVVIGDIAQKRAWRPLTLHSKLMLAGSAALIAWGWAMVLLLEWDNPGTLGPMGPAEKLMASWFQAVTPRTAGFNTIDIAAMEESTALVTILMMLIGGGSTSTAGGIKVTTFIVLLLATVAFFKRRTTLHVFGRSLGVEEVMKVMALTTVSILVTMTALFLISIRWEGEMFDLGFEVASAFGTVGLSRGATTELDGFGQLVICAVMFLGRVGPLTLGFFLATRSRPRVGYPDGQVYLG
ncbi:TrkH family potassium uptake protein [Limimaricola pyoseonensis]|uniref:Trk system potassium uptake protein TrkH n=1 Tax=Limimaricola pyoseonensis TaxID=521013 RepID=A0A1G7C9A7_9RHOB|nr:potassium transporter TrkG [Limimaricola pyoseonensis]SDE35962.1 trk system potassium uptake protein TrkH [Limimaricola pyoseonensis]